MYLNSLSQMLEVLTGSLMAHLTVKQAPDRLADMLHIQQTKNHV